jgi:hypothetical protein
LLSGSLTPSLQASLTRLGTRLPFAEAAQELQHFRRVQVSEPQARQGTEKAGAAYVAVQTAAVERLEREQPPAPAGPPVQLLSVDGAMVPLIHKEWAEAKTLALGRVNEPVLEKGEAVVHSSELSYFSRLTDAENFGRLALVETHRRGTETAGTVCAVNDGAEWEQRFINQHREDAVRILDFPHAASYLTQAAQAVWGEGSPSSRDWLDQTLHELKHGSADNVLQTLRDMQAEVSGRAEEASTSVQLLEGSLAYLEKRRPQLAYADFQAAGYPIGSGSVESANKLVVEARLKGAGMHWARPHVDPMLALRSALCSDRWDEAWAQISQQLRQQNQQQRAQRRRQRRIASPTAAPATASLTTTPTLTRVVDISSTTMSVPQTATTQTAPAQPLAKPPQRPAPNHPWRRFKVGRARFQPARSPSDDAKL